LGSRKLAFASALKEKRSEGQPYCSIISFSTDTKGSGSLWKPKLIKAGRKKKSRDREGLYIRGVPLD